jgi:AraC-like DNA-binding protein
MFRTAFTTDNLPRSERLERFDQLQATSEHPMRAFGVVDDPDFCARVESLDLAAVNVVRLTSSQVDIVRTPRQVRDFDPEFYSIILPLCGQVMLEQRDRHALLDDEHLALYSSSQPFRVRINPSAGPACLLRVQVPRPLLSLPESRLGRVLAVPLPSTSGVGALLAGFLAQLSAGHGDYTHADLSRLSNVLIDLINATLAHPLDVDSLRSPSQPPLLLRIVSFIEQHLEDPELSPASIAAAHFISVSYLHRQFQAHHTTTVAAFIRNQRLQRARRDLTDPQLRALPIHRIAARWGFADHATFTRAFRAHFGVPPSDFRVLTEPPAIAQEPRWLGSTSDPAQAEDGLAPSPQCCRLPAGPSRREPLAMREPSNRTNRGVRHRELDLRRFNGAFAISQDAQDRSTRESGVAAD